MKVYIKDNYNAHKWIFSIFWEKVLNIRGFEVFKLLSKIYSKLENEISTNAKALSQEI